MGLFDKLKAKMESRLEEAKNKAQSSLEEKTKEKLKTEAVTHITGIVMKKLLSDASWAQVAEDQLKEAVAAKTSEVVQEEVEKYTKGKHEDLTDIIIDEVTAAVVDEAVEKIKEQLRH